MLVPSAGAKQELAPGRYFIRITSQVIKRDRDGRIRISASSLYNKFISPNAIGNSIARCIQIGNRRTIPHGSQLCAVVYRMPLGQIVAGGYVSSPVYYKLAIVGGTGVYANVGGQVQVTAKKLVPRKDKLVFVLNAF